MIKKQGSKFVVTNKSGTKILGTHPSKEKAQKQLAAIEISKAKHMHEDTKRFKAFRNTLTESEYKETLTGYPNRGIATFSGPYRFDAEMLVKINAMLNAISRSTFQSPNEAFVRIKTRLNLMMLDFPWTPALWGSMGQVPPGSPLTGEGALGVVTLTVTRFGRVDGYDGITGQIRMDGKANGTDPFQEFTMLASVELAEDGLYRVNAKLMPKVEIVPEGVEHDGDALDEMAQTASREAEMKRKVQKHEDIAQRGYEAKMTKSGKAAARGRKLEAKHDAASTRLLKRSQKEQDSPRTYGRGGKLIKRGSRREVKEGVEAIEEMHKPGDTVKVPHKGKMVSGKIVRHDSGGSSKAAQHGGGYVVDVGEHGSITVPHHKIVKEETKKPWWEGKTRAELDAAAASASAARKGEEEEKRKRHAAHNKGKRFFNGTKWIKEEAEQIDEAGAAKAARLAKAKERAGREGDADRFERASAVQKRIIARLHKKKGRAGAVSEGLVGGQKKIDVNKNGKLDAQDFKLLRAKKKPVQEDNTTYVGNISLQQPDPTVSQADQSGKGRRFHKKAQKGVFEAAKAAPKKDKPHAGAAGEIEKQTQIKNRLKKYGMRW